MWYTVPNNGLEVMASATIATLTAQFFKIFWYMVCHGHMNFRIFFHTGGMPSSHSACMTGLAVSVGLMEGFSSTVFAVALGLAIIVMYDAAGVRRAAGKMAGILNKITEDIYKHHPAYVPERLRELLGHTPLEVFAGAFWGALVAYWVHTCL